MPRSRRIGGPLPGASEVMPTAQLAVQFASALGDTMQLGPLRAPAAVLRVILDIVQVRFTHCYATFHDEHIPLQEVKSNKDACCRLARRAMEFVLNIRDTMDGRWDPAPPSLRESVDRFESQVSCRSHD